MRQVSEEEVLKENEEYREDKEYKEEKEDREKIAQMKVQKEAWAKKRIEEIENEMKMLAQKRQEEMRKRKENEEDKEYKENKERMTQEKTLLPEVSTKPKKGLPFWGKRIKTAQQQAQPETAGRRVGG